MSEQNKNKNGISRRDVLKIGIGGAASLAAGAGLGTAQAMGDKPPSMSTKVKPNVLLIITDQQHLDTISAGGCNYVNTPAMDRLWRNGVAFKNCYSTNPVCSPARSTIFTGRMPSETGVFENNWPIHESIPNTGQWLRQEANYETIYTGKWHVPDSWCFNKPGFKSPVTGVGGQGNLGDTNVSMACDGFLRNYNSDKPFFLVCSLLEPHDMCEWLRLNLTSQDTLRYPQIADELPPLPVNFEPDENEPAKIKERRKETESGRGKWSKLHWRYYLWSYYRMVEQVDGEIGRVLNALDESGKVDNTLVIFMADHGEGMGCHQMVRKNLCYDEAAKVPLVVSFPGRIKAGVVDDTHLISQADIFPTICDYIGIKSSPHQRGRSLRPLLEGKNVQWRSMVACELGSNDTFARMIRTDRYKYAKYFDDPMEQLFDMKADPGETKNLAVQAHFADELKAHRKLLAKWEAKLILSPTLPENQIWPRS